MGKNPEAKPLALGLVAERQCSWSWLPVLLALGSLLPVAHYLSGSLCLEGTRGLMRFGVPTQYLMVKESQLPLSAVDFLGWV